MKATVRVLCLALAVSIAGNTQQTPPGKAHFPFPEKLTYRIEWRLITAGTAKLQLTQAPNNGWQIALDLESAGIVTRLYRVADTYKLNAADQFCGLNTLLEAQEGKKHHLSKLTFDQRARKVMYEDRDLVKNLSTRKESPIPACTRDVMGALSALRMLSLEPGHNITMPITDGKKVVNARLEPQARESVSVNGKTYQTIRYEAFLFDNVLYQRKGRLFIWMTDDADHIPVQIRVQLGFPIGTIGIYLDKEER